MKKGSVTDCINKNKANYKDTRITLNEVVLVPFFCRYFEHVLVCWKISRKFKGNIYKTVVYTVKNLKFNEKRLSKILLIKAAVHRRFQNKRF